MVILISCRKLAFCEGSGLSISEALVLETRNALKMDLNNLTAIGRSWVGNVCQKVEGVFQEMDAIVKQVMFDSVISLSPVFFAHFEPEITA